MTKKIVASVVIVISIVIVALAGAIFYASKILTPEKLQYYAQQAVAKSLPNAQLSVEKIELSFGLSVKAHINRFQLQLKSSSAPLMNFEQATVRIPLWAILTGGGTASVQIKSPEIHYIQYPQQDNWKMALADSKSNEPSASDVSEVKSDGPNKPESKVALPALVSNVRLDFQLNDLRLHYQLKDKSKGTVAIERLLVKQLSLIGSTAFEMRSTFKYIMKNGEEYQLSPMLIGEFSLGDYLSNGSLSCNMQLNLQNIVLGKTGISVPPVRSSIAVKLSKNGELQGDVQTTFSSSRIATAINVASGGKITISGLKIELLMADILSMLPSTMIPLELKPGSSALTVNGDVLVENGLIAPKINFGLSPSLSFSLDGLASAVQFNGSYNGKRLEVHSALEVLKGLVSTDLVAMFDINQKQIKLEQLPPFKVLTKVTNIELSDSFIRSKLYAPKKVEAIAESQAPEAKSVAKDAAKPLPLLPPGSLDIELSNIKIGDHSLNGKSKVRIDPRAITTEYFKMNFAGGQLSLQHKSLLKTTGIDSSFAIDLMNFNLLGIRPFLPSFVDAVTGIFSGKVKGGLNQAKGKVFYDIELALNARSGAIKGLKIGEFIEGFTEKVPMLKGQKFDFDSEKLANYETFSFDAKLTDQKYLVKRVEFVAVNKMIELKGKGELYPPPTGGTSSLYLDYRDGQYLSRALREATKSEMLPVLLTGKEFALAPDYGYSTKRLMKGAAKKVGEKAVDKAKEALKENGKKEVKKLLKSFGL